MANVKHSYGPWSQRMLKKLCETEGFKVASLMCWLEEKGLNVDQALFSQWKKGSTHLPADVLPLLAAYSENPEVVFSEYTRTADCEVLRLQPRDDHEGDLVDAVFTATDYMGRLSRAFSEARMPDSDGGKHITPTECESLLENLNDAIQRLVDLRSRLEFHIFENIQE